jgi:hypothetical protein
MTLSPNHYRRPKVTTEVLEDEPVVESPWLQADIFPCGDVNLLPVTCCVRDGGVRVVLFLVASAASAEPERALPVQGS